uniref:Uncharacterized protein n=1 Tax=Romanomermis culicivorax TaxID=13658 RepID=A0A915I421_ROMCU
MGTVIAPITEQLVGGNTLNPYVIYFVTNGLHWRIGFKLDAVVDCQFVDGVGPRKVPLCNQNKNGCLPGDDCSLGGDVTLTDAYFQLDLATIVG